MIKPQKKHKLSADLHSRNTLYGLLIEHFLKPIRDPKVLDVGGAEGKLAWFVPHYTEVTIADKRAASENQKTQYVQADATELPFADNTFDLVISSDLIEHIEEEKRPLAYLEMLRVTKRYAIIAAPFHTVYAEKAEELVNRQFKKYSGKDHPFLKDHIQNGLPNAEKLEAILGGQNHSFTKLGEGNIYNWALQQLVVAHMQGENLDIKKSEFNKHFNENLERLGNFRHPTYRTVYVIDKKRAIDKYALLHKIEEINNFHTGSYFESFRLALQEIRDIGVHKTGDLQKEQEKTIQLSQEIQSLHQELENLQTQISSLHEELHLTHTQLHEAQHVIAEKEAEIIAISAHAKRKENEASSLLSLSQKLQKRSADQSEEIDSLTKLNLHKEQLIDEAKIKQAKLTAEHHELARSHAEYKQELEKVITSRSWKFITKLANLRSKLIKEPARLIKRSAQVLKHMGPREVISRIKRKLKKPTTSSDYQKFIEKQNLAPRGHRRLRSTVQEFAYQPVISIVMPTYNIDAKWLSKAIDSVKNQIYPKWELLIADDASTNAETLETLRAQKDSRIKITYRDQNGGIVEATNSALQKAKGAYVTFLDNDDELSPDALFEVVKNLQNQKYDLLYSDEDKLELNGTRTEPHFKPDYDEDLLLSNNYICHLAVYRRKIVDELGGLRKGYDGAQDHDLVLRVTDKNRRIKHIPKILYHWRKIPGSTAATRESKSYATDAGLKAVTDACRRRNIDAEVTSGLWTGSYHVKRKLKSEPLISIIIPFRDYGDVLKTCLDSIFEKTTYQNFEILLINNQSSELQTLNYLKELKNCPRTRILDFDQPYNYSAINNFAARQAKGEYLLLLNNDTEVISENWIESMLEHAQCRSVGAVGAKLYYPNGQIQHAGVLVGVGGVANSAYLLHQDLDHGYFGTLNVIRNYSAVTAACMMIRRELFLSVGGLNQNELAVSFNDLDLCLRLRSRGFKIVYTPYARLYHHESLSRGRVVAMEEEMYIRREYAEILRDGDPFYNPNLTRDRFDYSLRV